MVKGCGFSMLTGIRVQNFRAHGDLQIAGLRRFSTLVGRNNSGKSSVLQALAWPRYGQWFQSVNQGLPIVRNESDPATITIGYTQSGTQTGAAPGSWVGHLDRLGNMAEVVPGDLSEQLRYVGLPRDAPRQYPFGPFATDAEAGLRAERVWQVLREMRDMDPEARARVDHWAEKIIGGLTRLRTPSIGSAGASVLTRSYGHDVEVFRQGSGVGAALPIIVQGVLCQPGECLLIEEPDLHLHSAAVRELVEFLRDLVKREVQVICATHSIDFVGWTNDWAWISETTNDSAGPPKGSFGFYEVKIDGSGATTVKFRDAADPASFRSMREALDFGV